MKNNPVRHVDPEQEGYRTMLEVRDLEQAKVVCGLRLHARADEIKAAIDHLATLTAQKKVQAAALITQLYHRVVPPPVSDVDMLALRRRVTFVTFMAAVALLVA